MPVSQMQEDDWTHTVWRLCSRTSLNLTLWHLAANMHPTMRMRRSNLKLPFGQESETWQMPVPFPADRGRLCQDNYTYVW